MAGPRPAAPRSVIFTDAKDNWRTLATRRTVFAGEIRMRFKRGTDQDERATRGSVAPSILGSDLTIEGIIVSEGELHICGSVKGEVVARDLTLAIGGSITGTVEADIAIIAGNLVGRLTATSVVLARTARLAADITHVSLTTEPGATFEGVSRHVDAIEAVAGDAVRTPRLTAPVPREAEPA
jgi:cytoskeletal protein CcmA (bactofilin family)